MYSAAIFDMDGLLIDSERVILRAWVEAARGIGREVDEADYAAVVGRTEAESVPILEALLGGAANLRRVHETAQQLLNAEGRPAFPLKSGAQALLQVLRSRGVPCAVASSTAVHEVRRRLDAVGVLEHFAAIVGGNEVPRGKPDPAIYALAAARLGVETHTCLAFEDSENGARSVLAAGMALVVVPDLRAPPPEVLHRAAAVLGELGHALERVPGWFAQPS